jgi:hypothetical protein
MQKRRSGPNGLLLFFFSKLPKNVKQKRREKMIKNYLTCERYLEHYNKGDKTVVGRLDTPEHICVTETDMSQETVFYNNEGIKIPRRTDHYLVGPIADTLHAYEELGYSPEELKKIIEEHKKYKERSLYISSAINMTYGSLGSPFRKKLEEMREAAERRKRMEYMLKEIGFPEVESLYPKVMSKLSGRYPWGSGYYGEKAVDGLRAFVTEIDEMHTVKPMPICKPAYRYPKTYVERAIFNDPATIVFWKDGTKTVVKAQKGEKYDPEKGLAMAFSKKMFGNEGNYYDQFTKLLPKKKDKK